MSSTDIVKIMLVACWTLLGIGLVLYVWRKQAKAAAGPKTKQEIDSNVEKLYGYFIEHPDGALLSDIISELGIKEDIVVQGLVQLETMGVVSQQNRGSQSYFVLNKNS